MFSPPSLDPLAHTDLQEHVIDLLMQLKQMNNLNNQHHSNSNGNNNTESSSSSSSSSSMGGPTQGQGLGQGQGNNLFPSWMGELSSPDQHLVQALVNSRI